MFEICVCITFRNTSCSDGIRDVFFRAKKMKLKIEIPSGYTYTNRRQQISCKKYLEYGKTEENVKSVWSNFFKQKPPRSLVDYVLAHSPEDQWEKIQQYHPEPTGKQDLTGTEEKTLADASTSNTPVDLSKDCEPATAVPLPKNTHFNSRNTRNAVGTNKLFL